MELLLGRLCNVVTLSARIRSRAPDFGGLGFHSEGAMGDPGT